MCISSDFRNRLKKFMQSLEENKIFFTFDMYEHMHKYDSTYEQALPKKNH